MTSPPSGVADAAGSQGQDTVAASTVCQVSPTRCQACTRLYRGGRLELEGFPVADISDYLADVSVTIWLDLRDPDHDDLAVLSEEFGLRDLVTSILETNLIIQGNRLNVITKKVTGWAAIIAVPTFITGYFGMNVPYPGFSEKAGFIGSLAIMILAALALYVVFKRKDWL
jgi:Mg2+ and Co2+ transporter CorA